VVLALVTKKTQFTKIKVAEEAMKQAFLDVYEDDNDDNPDEDEEKDEPLSLFSMTAEDDQQT